MQISIHYKLDFMKTKNVPRFKLLLKFSGTFNIVAASLFIIPQIYECYLSFFNNLNASLCLGGRNITIPTDPFHALFINTAGIDLVLIGVIVLLISNAPLNKTNRAIILCNGIGRTLFSVIIIYYALYEQLINILVYIAMIDFLITFGFLYFLHKTRNLVEICKQFDNK